MNQEYLNPLNPTTAINVSVPSGQDLFRRRTGNSQLGFGISDLSFVSLKVFDILGRGVATLVNEVQEAG